MLDPGGAGNAHSSGLLLSKNLNNLRLRVLLSFLRRRTVPSLALTGISRVTLEHREKLAIQRMSDTARLRRPAHAERDSLERSAA